MKAKCLSPQKSLCGSAPGWGACTLSHTQLVPGRDLLTWHLEGGVITVLLHVVRSTLCSFVLPQGSPVRHPVPLQAGSSLLTLLGVVLPWEVAKGSGVGGERGAEGGGKTVHRLSEGHGSCWGAGMPQVGCVIPVSRDQLRGATYPLPWPPPLPQLPGVTDGLE